jgi:hypothetical protein
VGGAAQPVNRQLFSGIPAIGEEYRHELAHLVLAPLVSARTSYFISEGVPTWVGGTTGQDFPTAVRGLAAFLTERPKVSLDSILSRAWPAAQFYPAAAMIAAMAHERGGVNSVKALFNAGAGDQLRRELERLLGRPWNVIQADWRARILQSAARSN